MSIVERKIWVVTEFYHEIEVETFTDEAEARKAYDAITRSYKMLSVVIETNDPDPRYRRA